MEIYPEMGFSEGNAVVTLLLKDSNDAAVTDAIFDFHVPCNFPVTLNETHITYHLKGSSTIPALLINTRDGITRKIQERRFYT